MPRVPAPPITTVMVALAWCVINCAGEAESAQLLARLVLEAAERP